MRLCTIPLLPELLCFLSLSYNELSNISAGSVWDDKGHRVAGASHKNPGTGGEDPFQSCMESSQTRSDHPKGECRAPKAATIARMSGAGLAPAERAHLGLALMLLNLWEQGTSLVPWENSLR